MTLATSNELLIRVDINRENDKLRRRFFTHVRVETGEILHSSGFDSWQFRDSCAIVKNKNKICWQIV